MATGQQKPYYVHSIADFFSSICVRFVIFRRKGLQKEPRFLHPPKGIPILVVFATELIPFQVLYCSSASYEEHHDFVQPSFSNQTLLGLICALWSRWNALD